MASRLLGSNFNTCLDSSILCSKLAASFPLKLNARDRKIKSDAWGLVFLFSLSLAATITIWGPKLARMRWVTLSWRENKSDMSPSKLSNHSCLLELASVNLAFICTLFAFFCTSPWSTNRTPNSLAISWMPPALSLYFIAMPASITTASFIRARSEVTRLVNPSAT